MVFSSFVLTIFTCISGCSNIANSVIYEALKEKTTTIINAASNAYDYSNYNLSTNEETSLLKQKLLKYYKDNDYLNSNEINSLEKIIKSSSDYTYFPDLDSLFINENNLESSNILNESKEILKNIVKIEDPNQYNISKSRIINQIYLPKISLTSLNSNFSVYNGNGGSSPCDEFPIFDYNEDEVSYYSSGKIDNTNFMGIICSKDACVSLYNLVAGFFNNLGNNNVNNAKGIGSIILEALKSLDTVACASASLIAAASTKIATALSTIFSKIMIFFQSFTGIIGKIIAVILLLVGASCIYVISRMIVAGYNSKGYAIGWKMKGLFNFSWYNGETN